MTRSGPEPFAPRHRRGSVLIAHLLPLVLVAPCAAAEVGPDNGVLVIVGGVPGPEILKQFVDLPGGRTRSLW